MQPSDSNFGHPYVPYDIQLGFMTSLYDCIEDGKVGIFESPTGTGKSLSLICGALTWLRDHKRREIDDTLDVRDDGEDWLVRAERENRRHALLQEREELEKKLEQLRREEDRKKRRDVERRPTKKARQSERESQALQDEEFMLEDYDSDEGQKAARLASNAGFSSSTQALLDQVRGKSEEDNDMLHQAETKIIFCSRTHSQLSQFVQELRRVKPPPSISTTSETVKHLSLGSRKNLCINAKVNGLSSTQAINERCLELQKPGTAKDHRCSYLPNADNPASVNSFRDRTMAKVRDIEDAAQLGQELAVCPYYASRSVIPPSEVLTLPYPLLLQKSARDALGVNVKDNVVIIDEAHNLMDAISDTLAVSMRLSQLRVATEQVMAYVQRFKNRLKGKNRVYVTQVVRLLNSITGCLQQTSDQSNHSETTPTAARLMSGKGVDQIRPHKLLQYLHESKLTHKVEGYADAQALLKDDRPPRGLLMQFQSLLMALMNPHTEGRFFANRDGNDIVLRYALLDPREHFRDIVEEARAVILAGGTMSPTSDYTDYLFSYINADRLRTFSFGHVVPAENIFATAITKGPSGIDFDFIFGTRGNEKMIAELGQLLVQICRVVPDGVVVFFPSYDYLGLVTQTLRSASIMDTLSSIKTVFEESKGVAADDLLREYAKAIDSGKGSLLLSVVGGKLSEGINFSDKLGRAVVAVGLPFPNANGAEWKAKIEYVEALQYKQCKEVQGLKDGEPQSKAKAAGRDFYENACMRAVNQSIGRAIRHRNDYAAILLVDRRFATPRIRTKLPGWITGSMQGDMTVQGWNYHENRLKTFFAGKH